MTDLNYDTQVRIAGIANDAIVDGPGIRLAVFFQGCEMRCPNCHNPHTHDLNGGEMKNLSEIIEMMDKNPLLDGITLTGGEPFLQADKAAVLAEAARARGLSVVAYTGYLFEQLLENIEHLKLVKLCDYITDGAYEEGSRSLELFFKGSKNQRIIDIAKTFETGAVCEVEEYAAR